MQRTAGVMKCLAVVNRGYKRDFLDLAEMLRHGTGLTEILAWATTDIPGLTRESVLRALAWRVDADAQEDPDGITPEVWTVAKRNLDLAIRGYLAP